MVHDLTHRPHTSRLSALALAALSLSATAIPAPAQTVYREYDDGTVEPWPGDNDRAEAPYRRRPSAEDDDDDRFERDDVPDYNDDDNTDELDDRQGYLDLSPSRETSRRAPAAPPSVNAKPDDKAWKPAL